MGLNYGLYSRILDIKSREIHQECINSETPTKVES